MEKKESRAPIVTVLGHVDHGKTTLLDAIRKTGVAAKEAGGITQSIGASQVTTKEGKKITFIDTPGHAAFSAMRSRGANVADIATLVVDASDGVKPQTLEALQMIKEAKIPFIVAATKIDLPSASVETVISQLEKQGVAFEGQGGDVPVVSVSAKTGKGMEELLEMISLVAEVHGIEGSKNEPLEAIVIETLKDKRGPLANVVVRKGILSVGREVYAEGAMSKVRGLFNIKGENVREAEPSEAVSVLGLEKPPSVGAKITSEKELGAGQTVASQAVKPGKLQKGQIPVILRAQTKGSLEAILASLPPGIVVIDAAAGDVNESDILLARADNSYVVAFESKVSNSVAKLAETEGVTVKKFAIIYELLEYLEDLLKGSTKGVSGKASIVAIFPFDNKKVAGSKVLEGKIGKTDNLVITRSEKEVGKAKVLSLKRGRLDINEAKAGEEFGVIFDPQLDFEVGDVIVSVTK
jgi:translation initiation factor IF-2